MKNIDRFIRKQDEVLSKHINNTCRQQKTILKEITNSLKYNIGFEWEYGEEFVSDGALTRASICIESMILLVREGYIGSANALFRQVYEHLVWAKLSIDCTDDSLSKKIHDDFYCLDDDRKNTQLTKYMKRITFQPIDLDVNEAYSQVFISKAGKDIYHRYSSVTHASVYAQQPPCAMNSFYEIVQLCQREISFLMSCYISVLKSYLDRCISYTYSLSDDIKDYINEGIMYGHLCDLMCKSKYKLIKRFPDIGSMVIYRVFTDYKWVICS